MPHHILAMRVLVAALVVALVGLSGSAAEARQDDPRLGGLFAMLKDASSEIEATTAETMIREIWAEDPDPDVEKLMALGKVALAAADKHGALIAFTAAAQRDDQFAEAWNQRALVEFALGDYGDSVVDIEHTLALEPRHFGALSGLGQIYLALGKKPAALKAFEAALAIDPHLKGVKETVETIKKDLAGDAI